MPSYRVHLVGGAATYFLVYKMGVTLFNQPIFTCDQHLLFLSITLLGSIFPDIDIASKMQRTFFRAALIIVPLALFYNTTFFLCFGAVCFSLLIIPHRTLTHRIWFLILMPWVCAQTIAYQHPSIKHQSMTGCIFFVTGALSHILLDFGPKRLARRKF